MKNRERGRARAGTAAAHQGAPPGRATARCGSGGPGGDRDSPGGGTGRTRTARGEQGGPGQPGETRRNSPVPPPEAQTPEEQGPNHPNSCLSLVPSSDGFNKHPISQNPVLLAKRGGAETKPI